MPRRRWTPPVPTPPKPEDEYRWDVKKWGAAGTRERAVRWIHDAQFADDRDRRKFSDVPDEELAERSGLPLGVVQRARPYVVRRYGE